MAEFDKETGTGGGLFHDEVNHISAARIFLAVWLAQTIVYVYTCIFRHVEPTNAVLAMDTSVGIGLMSWAGGARIAAYLGPQVAASGAAVAQALRSAIDKRRDAKDGIESTP